MKSTRSRSWKSYLRKATAFLITAAMVASFLPLQVLKVFADTTAEEFQIVFTKIPESVEGFGVQYQFNGTDGDWTNATIEETLSGYSFTIDKESDNLYIKFVLGAVEPLGFGVANDSQGTGAVDSDTLIENDKLTFAENYSYATYHYDDLSAEGHYFIFEIYNFGPTEQYPYLYEMYHNESGTIDVEEGFDGDCRGDQDNSRFRVCIAEKTLTVLVKPSDGSTLNEIRIATSEDPNEDIRLNGENNFTVAGSGVTYDAEAGTATLTIPEGETELLGISFIFGDINVTELTADYELTEDQTIGSNAGVVVKDCILTLSATLTIEQNGRLTLDGSLASIVNADNINPQDGALLAFMNGASVPDGIALYDEEGNAMTETSFERWEEFYYVSTQSKWTRLVSTETVIDTDAVIDEEIVINEGTSYRIVNCNVSFTDNGSITIKAGGNLILEGTAVIDGFTDKVRYEHNASLSFERSPVIPNGVILYDENGNELTDTVFADFTEFRYDDADEKWKLVVYYEVVFEENTTIDYEYVIDGGRSLRIKNCTVDFDEGGSITIKPGGSIILEGSAVIDGFTDKVRPESGACLALEKGAFWPENITLYNGDGESEFPDNPVGTDNYEEFMYDDHDGKWKRIEFDPQRFNVFIGDGSNIAGATLEYKFEYRVGETDWSPVDYEIDGNFRYPDNISNGTVTIDNSQPELMNLSFRLPDDLWVNDSYPNIDIRLTLPDTEELTLNSADWGFINIKNIDGYNDDLDVVTEGDNKVITFTNLNIFGEETYHDFTFDYSYDLDKTSLYGLEIWRFSDSSFITSDEGNTITFESECGSLTLTNGSKIIVEDTSEGYHLWSADPEYTASLNASGGYDAWCFYPVKDSYEMYSDPVAITVTNPGEDGIARFDFHFSMGRITFDGYTSVSPAPQTFVHDNTDIDYTLSATAYTITYEHGTVTIELVDQNPDDDVNPVWSGWINPAEGDNSETVQFETTDQVKLTFTPDEGYSVAATLNGYSGNRPLVLDQDKSIVTNLDTRYDNLRDPFVEDSYQYTFTGATEYNFPEGAYYVISYENGYAVVTSGEGGTVLSAAVTAAGVVVSCDVGINVNLMPSKAGYIGSMKVDDITVTDTFVDISDSGHAIDISFDEDPDYNPFIFELGGNIEGEPVVAEDKQTITVPMDHGRVEITGYDSYISYEGVSPAGSSHVGAYSFELEGTGVSIKAIPEEDYTYRFMQNGSVVADENGVLSFSNINKDNKIQAEVMFDPFPELSIGGHYSYNSQTSTLTYTDDDQNVIGTIEIADNPFTNGPTVPTQISEDVTFTVNPADGYGCKVQINGGREIYVTSTYTIGVSDLATSGAEEQVINTLTFTFNILASDATSDLLFEGVAENDISETIVGTNDYYKVDFDDGYILIEKDIVVEITYSDDATFSINKDYESARILFVPEEGYLPTMVYFGDEYNDQNEVSGEWRQTCEISYDSSVGYYYDAPLNPFGAVAEKCRVSFESTALYGATVTSTYEGVTSASITIGGNDIGSGVIEDEYIEYRYPLSLTADSDS
nr:hypothetical protein [Saccharofermentans sp.]